MFKPQVFFNKFSKELLLVREITEFSNNFCSNRYLGFLFLWLIFWRWYQHENYTSLSTCETVFSGSIFNCHVESVSATNQQDWVDFASCFEGSDIKISENAIQIHALSFKLFVLVTAGLHFNNFLPTLSAVCALWHWLSS